MYTDALCIAASQKLIHYAHSGWSACKYERERERARVEEWERANTTQINANITYVTIRLGKQITSKQVSAFTSI